MIDMDGVLYRGVTALPHAVEFIPWLRQRGVCFRLVTNNSTLTPEQYVDKLARLGMVCRVEEVFTSALATALYLEERGAQGQTALVIGEEGLLVALRGAGMVITTELPDWVVCGLDRTLTYARLGAAALALAGGARFLATNADRSLPTEQGLMPGAGAILAALTATTGREPVVVGKPEPLMLELAMRQIGGSVEDTAMLGDRLDTDILAANALHMPSILVLTGVSTRAELAASPIQPSIVADDLADLMRRWAG